MLILRSIELFYIRDLLACITKIRMTRFSVKFCESFQDRVLLLLMICFTSLWKIFTGNITTIRTRKVFWLFIHQ